MAKNDAVIESAVSADVEDLELEETETEETEDVPTEEDFLKAVTEQGENANKVLATLDFLLEDAFAINLKAEILRGEIGALTSSKAERRAEILNGDNPNVVAGQAFIAEQKAVLADAEKNLNALVETLLAESAPSDDVKEKKDTLRDFIGKVTEAVDAVANTVGKKIGEDALGLYFAVRDFVPVRGLRNSDGTKASGGGVGIRKMRVAEVTIDGVRVEDPKGASTLGAAANYLKKKGAPKNINSQTLLEAFSTDESVQDRLKTETVSWDFTYNLGEALHTVKIETTPNVSETDSE